MKIDNTFNLISKIHEGMNTLLLTELKKEGVTGIAPSHGGILLALFDGRKLSMNELSEQIAKTPQTVTTLVKKLSDMGYLQVEKTSKDKRLSFVSLTEEGESLKPVFMSISEQLFETQYRGLRDDEISELRRMLSIVKTNFSLHPQKTKPMEV